MIHARPTIVCASAARVLDALTDGLHVGGSRILSDPAGVHMPVVIERSSDGDGGAAFAVGQYHSAADGGRVWDPRVAFVRTVNGVWTPTSYEDAFTGPVRVERLEAQAMRQLTTLCNLWMQRIGAAHALAAGASTAAE